MTGGGSDCGRDDLTEVRDFGRPLRPELVIERLVNETNLTNCILILLIRESHYSLLRAFAPSIRCCGLGLCSLFVLKLVECSEDVGHHDKDGLREVLLI